MMTHSTAKPTDHLVIDRILDAPPELIWQMWTEPEHVMRWWGPAGFTSPECQIDLRVGGKYLFCMESPEGVRYYTTGVYKELVPYERIVYTDQLADADGNVVLPSYYNMGDNFPTELEVIVTLEDLGGRTKMTMTQVGMTSDYAHTGAEEGWNGSFDKLAQLHTVTSKDGTLIAYDKTGSGPALILVTGALGYRQFPKDGQLSDLLSSNFTVYDYDRRGRGDSGDAETYATEREIEDIEALIDAAGGSAYLYGLSSGAILALKAANALQDQVTKLALYEPPFILDDSRPPLPVDYVEQIEDAIARDDRSAALDVFMMQAMLIPEEYMVQFRQAPMWASMEKVAHTLAYDGIIVRELLKGQPWPEGTWSNVSAKTLVIVGENSEPFFHTAAKTLVNDLDNAVYNILPGQDHAVEASALAPMLIEFLAD